MKLVTADRAVTIIQDFPGKNIRGAMERFARSWDKPREIDETTVEEWPADADWPGYQITFEFADGDGCYGIREFNGHYVAYLLSLENHCAILSAREARAAGPAALSAAPALRYLLARVSQNTGTEYAEAEVRYVYARVDVVQARAREQILSRAAAADPDLWKELQFWTGSSWYLDELPDALGGEEEREEIEVQIDGKGFVLLSRPLAEDELEYRCRRTEMDMIHISPDGIHFSASEKYGVPVESDRVSWEDLGKGEVVEVPPKGESPAPPFCPNCGSTNVCAEDPDDEGLLDCLECGIWFDPAHPDNQGEAPDGKGIGDRPFGTELSVAAVAS